jgi:hypothetical protein
LPPHNPTLRRLESSIQRVNDSSSALRVSSEWHVQFENQPYGVVSVGGISVGESVGAGCVKEGVGVRVGSGVGGTGVDVTVDVRVCVSVGGMNSVSVRVADWIGGGAVVPTGGGGRRVEVVCTLGLGMSWMVGVGWMTIKTAAVQ